MNKLSFERCKTGIPGFDSLAEGGLVRNSVNVVLGGPGTGKTTFLMQFLWNGAVMFKENGLFVSFESDIESLFQDALSFGWNFSALEAKGMCKFVKFSPKTNVREMKTELSHLISRYDIKRVCIDPISLLAMEKQKESEIREIIFELTSLLKRMNVSVLLSDETDSSCFVCEEEARTETLKFLSDGLINLYSSNCEGGSERLLRITKMRRTNHFRDALPFKMNDKGIIISIPREKNL